jgi:hypothetical protein
MLDTLAQNGTGFTDTFNSKPILVAGNGSDLSNEKTQKSRARRKTITQKIVLSLMDIAKERQDHNFAPALWNTYHCQSTVYTADGRLFCQSCKNRFCTNCSAIRKADIINKYLPVIQIWEKPFFLTLTAKAVPAEMLKSRIDKMLTILRLIIDKYKSRSKRGKGIKLMGIWALECNFNPVSETYNPHFHIILPNLKVADTLMREWYLYWNDKTIVSKAAQYNTPVKNKEDALIEIVKYAGKIFTDPDMKKKFNRTKAPVIYAAALYNILSALQGYRIFERFGFTLPDESKRQTTLPKVLNDYEKWEFDNKRNDWGNSKNSGKLLTNYSAGLELIDILRININTSIQ